MLISMCQFCDDMSNIVTAAGISLFGVSDDFYQRACPTGMEINSVFIFSSRD